jgi:soluble lytic murein transglycosylase
MKRASYNTIPTLMLRSLALVLCLSLSAAAAAQPEMLRPQFAELLKAAEAGRDDAAIDSAALRGYVLYPYLQAARLRSALKQSPGEAGDAAITAFLQAHQDLPVARDLRRDWVLSLADRALWNAVLANDDPGSSDLALRCTRYNAWLQTGGIDNAMRDELLSFWLSGQQAPQACVPPFNWLKDQGLLTPERVEQRARAALAAGNPDLAEWLIKPLPPERAAPLQLWIKLLRTPKPGLEALIAAPQVALDWSIVQPVWAKFARGKPLEAEPMAPLLRQARRLDAAQAAELQRDLAIGHALDRRDGTVAMFRRLPDSAMNEQGHEWRVRAALWAGDWAQAAAWLHAMPPAQAAEPRWSYWRARSLEQQGRNRQSTPIYETLAQDNGYYAVLSAWRLGRKYTPQSQPLVNDPELQQLLMAQPAMLRARELFLINRADLANAEWRLALQGRDDLARVQAARLASSWGWHIQSVGMLNQMNLLRDLELLYPEAFTKEIEAGARFAGIPGPWIYGVMRQESLFLPTAVSRSQALGLLQLLMPTAQQVAKKWGRPAPTRESLFDPAINVPLGAAYLRDQTDRFGGRFILTLGAYNAGPNAVARWLPREPKDADVWIENVPYNETRGYIQKILWHITADGWRSTGQPQDLSPLLLPVGQPTVQAQACIAGQPECV